MPALPSDDDDTKAPTLYDTLPLTRRINIFSSLLRDHPNLPSLLSSQTPHQQTTTPQQFTILAPLNSALKSLPHKPWESPTDYTELGERAYDGETGQERAKGNLRRFVEGHIIPVCPWGEGVKVKTLAGEAGGEAWWVEKEDDKGGKSRLIMPEGVEVDEVVEGRAENGEVWVIRGVLGQ